MTEADRREHLRTALNAKVSVSLREQPLGIYSTRDISDGGIFVILEDDAALAIGDRVQVQVQGMPGSAPVLDMVVVRKTIDGFGLQFDEA
ncbi:MAG: PilZ domain-containing protein [Oleiphilaceae bacterium]|nr:PilZ domain-containing protein [Oleiphilaceae bacterium]